MPTARPPVHRAALIAALLVAIVLAQSLGLIHRIAHAHRGASLPVAQWSVPSAPSVEQAPALTPSRAAGWLQALFLGHGQDGSCDLYDQLTHADALLSVPAVLLPAAHALPPAEVHRAWHLAAQSAGFLARGPPALS